MKNIKFNATVMPSTNTRISGIVHFKLGILNSHTNIRRYAVNPSVVDSNMRRSVYVSNDHHMDSLSGALDLGNSLVAE